MAKRYEKALFEGNDTYTVHKYRTRKEWEHGRFDLHGIGGSDASAAIGLNPWRSNIDLWEIKTGRKAAADISDNERVRYGQEAEDPIRRLFQLKNPEYEVNYIPNCILQNKKHPELLYSPDGLIYDRKLQRPGILEIKTTTIMKSYDSEKWWDKVNKIPVIPENYYIQVLHGLNVTGFAFVDLYAELTYPSGSSELRTYHIEAAEVEEDLETVREGVVEFWREYVLADREPPLIIKSF